MRTRVLERRRRKKWRVCLGTDLTESVALLPVTTVNDKYASNLYLDGLLQSNSMSYFLPYARPRAKGICGRRRKLSPSRGANVMRDHIKRSPWLFKEAVHVVLEHRANQNLQVSGGIPIAAMFMIIRMSLQVCLLSPCRRICRSSGFV